MSKWRFIDKGEDTGADYVLVCYELIGTKKRFIEIGHISEFTPKSYFEGIYPLSDSGMSFRKIIAWMPLPEVP
jgi:hypothetical protein